MKKMFTLPFRALDLISRDNQFIVIYFKNKSLKVFISKKRFYSNSYFSKQLNSSGTLEGTR